MVTRRECLTRSAAAVMFGRIAVAAGAGGADLAAAPDDILIALQGKKPLIKRTFRPPNFETPLADLRQPFTPNDAFYIRYHLAAIPEIDPRTWRLRVSGASTRRPLEVSLHDLKRDFEHIALAAVNQCSGNRRGLFTPRVAGVQWGNGAMGHALWGGVRLRDVLHKCDLQPDALEVVFDGADGPVLPATPDFQKSLPIARALDENTLIAFEMNGHPLPHFNGAPARLVVPGWTGTYWVKHLTDIRVQPQPFDGFWMKGAYRIPTGAFPGTRFVSQETPETTPITQILVNSLVTNPAPGTRLVRDRPAALNGWAWDGGTGIASVEVSLDGGRSWRRAALGENFGRFAWRGFRLPLDTSRAGPVQLAVRATSRGGERQPEKLTVNPAGYHDNKILSIALEIV